LETDGERGVRAAAPRCIPRCTLRCTRAEPRDTRPRRDAIVGRAVQPTLSAGATRLVAPASRRLTYQKPLNPVVPNEAPIHPNEILPPQTPVRAQELATKVPARKPGAPNKPLGQVIGEIKTLRAEDPKITKTRLGVKIGVSHGYIEKALNAIEEEEKKNKPASAKTKPSAPASTPPADARSPAQHLADAMGVGQETVILGGLDPSNIRSIDAFTEAAKKLPTELQAALLETSKVALKQVASGKSPIADAMKVVDQTTRDKIVAEALTKTERSLAAGALVWEAWKSMGLDPIFDTPAEFLQTASTFWWNNRDRYWSLVQEIEQLKAEIVALNNTFGPIAMRRQMRQDIYDRVITTNSLGKPLSPVVVMLLLADVDAVAENRTIDYFEELKRITRLMAVG
jgi:hypothetical protein